MIIDSFRRYIQILTVLSSLTFLLSTNHGAKLRILSIFQSCSERIEPLPITDHRVWNTYLLAVTFLKNTHAQVRAMIQLRNETG